MSSNNNQSVTISLVVMLGLVVIGAGVLIATRPVATVEKPVIQYLPGEKAPAAPPTPPEPERVEIDFGNGGKVRGPGNMVYDVEGDFGNTTEQVTNTQHDSASTGPSRVQTNGAANEILQSLKFEPTDLALGEASLSSSQQGWNYTVDMIGSNGTTIAWVFACLMIVGAAFLAWWREWKWAAYMVIGAILLIALAVASQAAPAIFIGIVILVVIGLVFVFRDAFRIRRKDNALGPIVAAIDRLPDPMQMLARELIAEEAKAAGVKNPLDTEVDYQKRRYGGAKDTRDINGRAAKAAREVLHMDGPQPVVATAQTPPVYPTIALYSGPQHTSATPPRRSNSAVTDA